MNLQTVTVTVADMSRARTFYEDVLGFTRGPSFEPTRWQSYDCNGQLFGIRELDGFVRSPSHDITNFEISDVDQLWNRIKSHCEVVEELAMTPWGSYRFVIRDPDGYQLAFVAPRS